MEESTMYKAIQIVNPMLIALALSGCGNATNTQHQNKDLVSTQWIVESFQDSAGRITDPGTVTLRVRFLEPDSILAKPLKEFYGTFIGRADNEFFGTYRFQSNALSLKIQGTTLVGRRPGSREQDFMDALNNAAFYEIHENKLRIYYFGKTRVLNLLADQ
jgi:heat shock protein HslJ